MIGRQLGVGVSGTVIAAMQHATRPDLVVVLVVDTRNDREQCITGLVRVDADGEPIGREWDNGFYHRSVHAAVVTMTERSGHIEYGQLRWTD